MIDRWSIELNISCKQIKQIRKDLQVINVPQVEHLQYDNVYNIEH